jgi:hypothetical protein
MSGTFLILEKPEPTINTRRQISCDRKTAPILLQILHILPRSENYFLITSMPFVSKQHDTEGNKALVIN